MPTRYFALVIGIIYTLVAILGLIPAAVVHHPADPQAIGPLHGRLLGLFPVNLLHTLVHLGIGIWGLAAWRTFTAAVIYSRSLAIIYGVLAIFGIIPGLMTLFGLVPLHGHDVWLHALTAIIAAYFGWAAPGTTEPGTRPAP